jgi:hypothetical protein
MRLRMAFSENPSWDDDIGALARDGFNLRGKIDASMHSVMPSPFPLREHLRDVIDVGDGARAWAMSRPGGFATPVN